MLEVLHITPDMHTTATTDPIEEDAAPHAGLQPDKTKDEDEKEHFSHPKRLKITRADLLRYGYSDHCPTCNLYRLHQPERANGSRHTEACRKRIYDHLRNDGSPRLANAERAGRTFSRGTSSASSSAPAPGDTPSSPDHEHGPEPLRDDQDVGVAGEDVHFVQCI